jgi:niacin transporter
MNHNKLYTLLISAMLCAIGIVIPLVSPLKIILEPASFTLGSHVAIYIAMYISPICALSVAIGTTFGFLMGGFPIVVVMRAATHIIFATIGALILAKKPTLLDKPIPTITFAALISLLHATSEVLVVIPFYFSNRMSGAYYSKGFLTSVILLVGVGTLIHSLIDFAIARVVWAPLKNITRQKLKTA